jgi:endonuclease/exonuclease/phosphatase family metal-dependent hydrolase
MIDALIFEVLLDDSEKIRILEPIIRSRKGNYILTGDFNTLSDQEVYDKELLTLGHIDYMGSRATALKAADKLLDRRLIKHLRNSGLKDAFTEIKREFTFPTPILPKAAKMRLDYFFTSKISVKDTYVIKNSLTDKASDHYPICMTFSLSWL